MGGISSKHPAANFSAACRPETWPLLASRCRLLWLLGSFRALSCCRLHCCQKLVESTIVHFALQASTKTAISYAFIV
jgi:hypothetical protein